MGRKRIHPQKPKRTAGGVASTAGSKGLARLASDPTALFRSLAQKLGGAAPLAEFLGCSRATAYNLLAGRKRWSAAYLQKALAAMGERPVINVHATARGRFEMLESDWRYIKPRALVLDCDGAFLVKGHALWPLVADGQFLLYRGIQPKDIQKGDIVLAGVKSGETLIKAWYPAPGRKGEVFLASLYRGPKDFRHDLMRPFKIKELKNLRKVVGVWMG